MPFDGYYAKIHSKIRAAACLEDLVVWRKRINISHSGLPFKSEQGRLIPHRYTKESNPND